MSKAIYTRISSDPEGLRLGVERQREDCYALAERLWPNEQVIYYEDNDTSAWSGKPRPQYEEMLEDIASGVLDGLVVYNLDRLHRHPRELEAFIDLCQRVRLTDLHTVAGDVDLATSDGQLMARVMGAVAKKESDDKSRRIKRAKDQLARQGRSSGGGLRPFGYTADGMSLVPSEADAVRGLVYDLLAGVPMNTCIATHLAHIPRSYTSKAWTAPFVYKLLNQPRIAGLRTHRGEIVGSAAWPAIITPAEFEQLRQQFARNKTPRGTARILRPRTWFLTGLVVCGQCGGRMYGQTTRRATAQLYVCGGADCSIGAPWVEGPVTEHIARRLEDPRLAAFVAAPRTERRRTLEADLAALRGRRAVLVDDYAAGLLEHDEYRAALTTLAGRISATAAQIDALAPAADPPASSASFIRREWLHLTVEQRARIAQLLVATVLVAPSTPATRPDPTRRVTIVPRDDLRDLEQN